MTHFRQIPDARSHGFAYLLADVDKREAVLIDPVESQTVLYLGLLDELQVDLTHILLTHTHDATAAAAENIRTNTGARLAAGEAAGIAKTDLPLQDGDCIAFGDELIRALKTPGHTRGCMSFVWRDRVFSGDALLIDDCGTSKAEEGDPGALFDSLTRRLLTLPDETLVYPAHDFHGRRVSCIGEQREKNPMLTGLTRDEFIAAQRTRTSTSE